MKTWLLLTADNKSPAPYLIVPSPTPYDILFSYSTARLAYRGKTDSRLHGLSPARTFARTDIRPHGQMLV